jgi:hypothetical protein
MGVVGDDARTSLGWEVIGKDQGAEICPDFPLKIKEII